MVRDIIFPHLHHIVNIVLYSSCGFTTANSTIKGHQKWITTSWIETTRRFPSFPTCRPWPVIKFWSITRKKFYKDSVLHDSHFRQLQSSGYCRHSGCTRFTPYPALLKRDSYAWAASNLAWLRWTRGSNSLFTFIRSWTVLKLIFK